MKKRSILRSQIVYAKHKGQIAVPSVLILFAVGVIISISGVLSTLDSAKNAASSQYAAEAFFLADGCMEEAFMRYKYDEDYTGGNLSLGEGSCIITVTGSGQSRDIRVEGTIEDQTQILTANVTRFPFSINTWQEAP